MDEDIYHYIGCINAERADCLPVEVAETRSFQRDADRFLSEGDRAQMHIDIALDPESGVIIQGTGGVRKLRWAGNGKGKRGGFRIVYYFYNNDMPIYLLAIYAKNEKIDISDCDKSEIKKLVRELVEEYKSMNRLRLIS